MDRYFIIRYGPRILATYYNITLTCGIFVAFKSAVNRVYAGNCFSLLLYYLFLTKRYMYIKLYRVTSAFGVSNKWVGNPI